MVKIKLNKRSLELSLAQVQTYSGGSLNVHSWFISQVQRIISMKFHPIRSFGTMSIFREFSNALIHSQSLF